MFELIEVTFYFPMNLSIVYLSVGLIQFISMFIYGLINNYELNEGIDLLIGIVQAILGWPLLTVQLISDILTHIKRK